jgi:hypothetical protein
MLDLLSSSGDSIKPNLLDSLDKANLNFQPLSNEPNGLSLMLLRDDE